MTTINIVSIIGGGAVGVSLLYQIIKKNTDSHSEVNLEINIFEKNLRMGRGLAYANDSQINLLNRPADSMSAIHGNMNDFMHWLASNNEWRHIYPDLQLDKIMICFYRVHYLGCILSIYLIPH